MRVVLLLSLAAAMAAGMGACDGGPTEVAVDVLDIPDAAADAVADLTVAEVLGDTELTETAVPAELVIGVNVTGTNTPADYSPIADGSSLEIEYGPQGLWMVVLAFKTRGIFDPKAKLMMSGTCTTGDTLRGELALAKQTLLPGGDGWYYYYNFFLVVDEDGASGQDASIVWTVEDPDSGVSRTETVGVRLVGGP